MSKCLIEDDEEEGYFFGYKLMGSPHTSFEEQRHKHYSILARTPPRGWELRTFKPREPSDFLYPEDTSVKEYYAWPARSKSRKKADRRRFAKWRKKLSLLKGGEGARPLQRLVRSRLLTKSQRGTLAVVALLKPVSEQPGQLYSKGEAGGLFGSEHHRRHAALKFSERLFLVQHRDGSQPFMMFERGLRPSAIVDYSKDAARALESHLVLAADLARERKRELVAREREQESARLFSAAQAHRELMRGHVDPGAYAPVHAAAAAHGDWSSDEEEDEAKAAYRHAEAAAAVADEDGVGEDAY